MRIGELADSTGVSTRSLRYYEEQGLIRSSCTAGGWREFDQSMVERVVMIQHLLAAGPGSTTIGGLLPAAGAGAGLGTREPEWVHTYGEADDVGAFPELDCRPTAFMFRKPAVGGTS
jgi:hypothetical protein